MTAFVLPFVRPPVIRAAGLTRAVVRLKRAARARPHVIRLQTIVRVLGQDGLLTLNAMLAILNILLTPLQGVSLPLGFIQMMIVVGLLRGRQSFWLPRRWRLYPVPSERLGRLLDRGLPALYRLEKISRPRLPRLMRVKLVRDASLWLMLILAALVALPVPFLNTTTSFAALLLCLALINKDGVMWLAGTAATLSHGLIALFWRSLAPHVTDAWHQLF